MRQPATQRHRPLVPERLLPFLLIAMGITAYATSLDGPFVFDDLRAIPKNTHIRSLWPLSETITAPAEATLTQRPLLSLSLALNYAVCGDNVRGYHIVNVVIHLLAGLTLYGIIRRTLAAGTLRARFGARASPVAWVAATIWTVHPVQTQSVTYIIQRAESLMGLFYLLTLYAAVRRMHEDRALLWALVSILACAMGMACKQVMVTAPVMVLLYDRTFVGGSFVAALRQRRGLYAGLASAWLVIVVIMVTMPASERMGLGVFQRMNLWDYPITQFGVVVHYLRLCIWPVGLCFDYGWPLAQNAGRIVPPMMLIVVLLAATIWGLRRNHGFGFLGAWFFGILSVTSSIVPITDMCFEQRLYLSLAGVVVFVVICGHWALQRVGGTRGHPGSTASHGAVQTDSGRLSVVLSVVVVVLLTWVTIHRNRDYRSAASLWQSVVEAVPRNDRGHINLGKAYMKEGQTDNAIKHYHNALQINPHAPETHYNLGNALWSQKKADDAIRCYRKALEINPELAEAYCNLGNVLLAQKKVSQAELHYQQALEQKPDLLEAHYGLGVSARSLGRADDAERHYRRALEINPRLAIAHSDLGAVLQSKGNLDGAIKHCRRALQIDPNHAQAHFNLGASLNAAGVYTAALKHYEQAAALKPDWAAPLIRAAWILATHHDPAVRHPEKAIRWADRGLALTHHRSVDALDALAAGYASLGRFDRAVEIAQTGLNMATAAQVEGLIKRMAQRVQLYQKSTPYVQDFTEGTTAADSYDGSSALDLAQPGGARPGP